MEIYLNHLVGRYLLNSVLQVTRENGAQKIACFEKSVFEKTGF